MALLVLLYMVQGIPLGLTTGAMPFMLQSKLTYAQVGTFSLAAYPYSLKLLWSPIVDSCFSPRLGRRKSWIVPVQLITAAMLIFMAGWISALYDAADVNSLTLVFLVFVFMAATQDIAVDGWALTLLSPANVGYASTCQTIGTSTGYFTSFTIFIALNSPEFCDTYIRSWPLAQALGMAAPGSGAGPLVTLPGYLKFWGWFFAAVTAAIAFFIHEKNFSTREHTSGSSSSAQRKQDTLSSKQDASALGRDKSAASAGGKKPGQQQASSGRDEVKDEAAGALAAAGGASSLAEVVEAYRQLWGVMKLPAVWALTAFLLTYRIGVLAPESAYSLKLIDKGVSKEALAFLVLLQFPIELGSALLAGRWAANHSPYSPFMCGLFLRMASSAWFVLLTHTFPQSATSLAEHRGPFLSLAAANLVSSFANTLTFTSIGSFFNSVSDPAIGGAYLTLLNTIANMGYILPKTPLFYLMDALTTTSCTAADGVSLLDLQCPKKVKDMGGVNPCTSAGGSCALLADGFYTISISCLVVGALLWVLYMRVLPVLMSLPLSKWRVAPAKEKAD